MEPIQNTRYKMLNATFRYWFPVILWAGLIFYFSSIPSLSSGLPDTWDFISRKLAHIFVYAVLTFLLFRALNKGYRASTRKALWLAVLLALLYGCSDEYHQTFVSGREGRVRDVAIDTVGIAAVGFFVAEKFRKR